MICAPGLVPFSIYIISQTKRFVKGFGKIFCGNFAQKSREKNLHFVQVHKFRPLHRGGPSEKLRGKGEGLRPLHILHEVIAYRATARADVPPRDLEVLAAHKALEAMG